MTLKCERVYIPMNNLDIAIIGIIEENSQMEKIKKCKKIQISPQKILLLDKIYSFGFSYFSKAEILRCLKYPNIFTGVISKIIKYGNLDFLYQVDSSSYSGGSGGPMINEKGYLVGVLFQNLTFHIPDSSIMQIPNSGFIISKEIISIFINAIEVCGKNREAIKTSLASLWICNVPNEEIENFFNYQKYTPKF